MNHLKNLKEELSGSGDLEGRLTQILKKFYETMSQDTMIGFFFAGKDLDKIVKGQRNLLMTAMGINQKYDGVPVNQAHMNLPPILEGHFNRRLVILGSTLESFKIQKNVIQEWLEFEKKFYNVIVKS